MERFTCPKCGTQYPTDIPRWRCECGAPLDLEFEPTFNREDIAGRDPTIWRYREAIPIRDDRNIVSLDEGFTPLLEVDLEGRRVLVKGDHQFPTGSFKDRGASVLVSKIKELGITDVVEDSSGNAGCAITAYCSKAGIRCTIYVPEGTSQGKLETIEGYGANLVKVPGTREDTAEEAMRAAEKTYYASHVWNPFFHHGTKTFAYEVCEQLGWRTPDSLVLPVGNGTLLLGAYIGFRELKAVEIVDKIPRLIAIQARACAPLYHAFKENLGEIDRKKTIAEGIAVAEPVRGTQILEAVRATGGDFYIVSDEEIRTSREKMKEEGFDIEPTAAATTAGLTKHMKRAEHDELVVSVFTGRRR
jgi:threonine synthase